MPLVVALALAAAATLALFSYVHRIENRTNLGAQPVSVLVAKATIPAGMSMDAAITNGLIVTKTVARTAIVAGAITSLDAVRGRVANSAIIQGEQISAARFTGTLQTTGVLPIPKGRQAFSVQAELPSATGGFAQPGDRVSIIAKLDVASAKTASHTVVRYLLQNVQILAVGSRIAPATGSDTAQVDQKDPRLLLTLALTPQEAEKLAFAVLQGEIYFTLVPRGQADAKTAGRTASNVFGS
jgi:pilus assembly protein CpaB